MPATTERAALRVTRLIQAPCERVFEAWISPAEIKKWFGPEGCEVLSASIEPRPGGEYHIRVESQRAGVLDLRGAYQEVSRPSRLVYSWKWSGNPQMECGETLVSVDFSERNGFTEVEITHRGLPSSDAESDHHHGWNGSLDRLEKLMQGAVKRPARNLAVWFDLPVLDLDRAVSFYSAVLGSPVQKQQFSGMSFAVLPHEEGAVSGCLTPKCENNENQPSPHGVLLYLNCQGRLDAAVEQVEPHGGKIQEPKHPIGPYGFRAVVLDSEGNRIALHSM